VVRLLNDVNDDPDQLPVLQHALMRTWDYWIRHRTPSDEPMDTPDYEAIGTMRHALSVHAEEAYEEAGSEPRKQIVQRLFRALTDTFSDPRGVRRPTSVGELAEICDTGEADIVSVIELFRRSGRCFLMPPAGVALESRVIVDISHESVMRCWDRLMGWAEEERVSASRYLRLARAAAWYEEGTGDLWRDPTLEIGLQWRQSERPTAAWAKRYDPAFDRAMTFLDRSRDERDRLAAEQAGAAAEKEQHRRRELLRTRIAAAVMAALLAIAGVLGFLAKRVQRHAEDNFRMANRAVEAMLTLAGSGAARIAPDVPQVEALRKELADTAREFFLEFIKQKPGTEELRNSVALAHIRLGDINRILQDTGDAIEEYRTAIEQLEPLARARPDNSDYRKLLATAYNWLGESERLTLKGRSDAIQAFNSAIALQEGLIKSDPGNLDYQKALARILHNRGIAQFSDAQLRPAEADYQAAIGLLEPLLAAPAPSSPPISNAGSTQDKPEFQQDLARVYNDLATLLKAEMHPDQAQEYLEKAIGIHEGLSQQYPDDRDYTLELAEFYENLGILFQSQQQFNLAKQNNDKAIMLYEGLSRPASLFTANLAYARTLHGRILQSQGDRAGAAREYQVAIDSFAKIEASSKGEHAEFLLQYGDCLLSLGNLWHSEHHPERAVTLLAQAAKNHSAARAYDNLAYDYYLLTQSYLDLSSTDQAAKALDNLSSTLTLLPEAKRTPYDRAVRDFEQKIKKLKSRQDRRN
jgi:tetratricopeptide (TPR) repeat protein